MRWLKWCRMSHKMTDQLKQRWLDELESGKWKQGKRILHGPADTHCCLGVLDSICGNISISRQYLIRFLYGLEDITLTEKMYLTMRLQSHLSDLNNSDKNFVEIAKFIKEETIINDDGFLDLKEDKGAIYATS